MGGKFRHLSNETRNLHVQKAVYWNTRIVDWGCYLTDEIASAQFAKVLGSFSKSEAENEMSKSPFVTARVSVKIYAQLIAKSEKTQLLPFLTHDSMMMLS
jgi:hypothetical protein